MSPEITTDRSLSKPLAVSVENGFASAPPPGAAELLGGRVFLS